MSDIQCGCSMIVTYVYKVWRTFLGHPRPRGHLGCSVPKLDSTAGSYVVLQLECGLLCAWVLQSVAWTVDLGDFLRPLRDHAEQRTLSKSLVFSGLGLSDCWDRILSTEFLAWVTMRPVQRSCPFQVPSNPEPSNLSTHYALCSALTSFIHWSPIVFFCKMVFL